MAMQVLCQVATTFQNAAYYTTMVDETTHISNCVQDDDDDER